MQGADGHLYGTTFGGGASDLRVVFRVVLATAEDDLIETAVTKPPGTAVLKGSFSAVTDTAKNNGAATAGVSTTRYYLSLDT